MGMNHWEWEGMKLKTLFPLISTWAQDPAKERTGQLKSHIGVIISHISGEAPNMPIETQILVMNNLPDVIEFEHETLSGYDFTADRISHFAFDFARALQL